jgi:beta-galactosidase
MKPGVCHYPEHWPEDRWRKRLPVHPMPEGLRLSRRGSVVFAINYLSEPRHASAATNAIFLPGNRDVPPAGVAARFEETK